MGVAVGVAVAVVGVGVAAVVAVDGVVDKLDGPILCSCVLLTLLFVAYDLCLFVCFLFF